MVEDHSTESDISQSNDAKVTAKATGGRAAALNTRRRRASWGSGCVSCRTDQARSRCAAALQTTKYKPARTRKNGTLRYDSRLVTSSRSVGSKPSSGGTQG